MDLKLTDSDNLNEFFYDLRNHAKDQEEYVYIGRHTTRYISIWKILKKFDFSSVLDIGCGRGHFGLLLKVSGKKYVGLDVQQGVEICIERGLETYPANIETEKFPINNESFDMVLCLEVIEHLEDIEFLLSEVKRVLKNNGVFVVSTPNAYMPSWIIREILFHNSVIKKLITGSDRKDENSKHDRLFKRKELIKTFKEFGFEILISKYMRIVFPFDDILIIGRKIDS